MNLHVRNTYVLIPILVDLPLNVCEVDRQGHLVRTRVQERLYVDRVLPEATEDRTVGLVALVPLFFSPHSGAKKVVHECRKILDIQFPLVSGFFLPPLCHVGRVAAESCRCRSVSVFVRKCDDFEPFLEESMLLFSRLRWPRRWGAGGDDVVDFSLFRIRDGTVGVRWFL